MKKLPLFLGLFVLFCAGTQLWAQDDIERLNDYKYVIIPMQFDFQSEENQYMVNSKLKYLLNQQGFDTYMDVEDGPMDLEMNSCLALRAELKSDAEGFLAMQTKLRLVFRDCRNRVVYESEEGSSREKEFKKGYLEALDDIFAISFTGFEYQYNGNVDEEEVAMADENQNQRRETEEEGTSAPEKKVESQGLPATKDRIYTLNGVTYGIHKIQAGYLLLNEETGEREALLHETDENTILYNSTEVNGTASIKDGGKAIKVEYFDSQKGGVQSFTLEEKK